MRTRAMALTLGLASGCYLFSDEPKARKLPDSGSASADAGLADADADADEAGGEAGAPGLPKAAPSPEASDCPEVLTGVEEQARVVAASCSPVRVRGSYRVEGGSLTLEAGVELRFEPGAALEVGHERAASLMVQGTSERPVRMIADSVSESGGWKGVRLGARADGSRLAHVELANAGTPEGAALVVAATSVSVEGLRIHGHAGLALELSGGRGPELLGVELSGSGVVARATPDAVAGLQELKLQPGASVAVSAGRIETTLEWPPNPYRVEGAIRIEGEEGLPAQLSLAPGASLAFVTDARLIVGGLGPGSLSATASSSAPAPTADPAPGDGAPGSDPTPGPSTPSSDPSVAPLFDERIRLIAADDTRPGSWAGVHVQDQGRLILRNVELAHGGARDEGVILAEGRARLSLEGCHFVSNLVGVELRGSELTVETFTGNRFEQVPVAVRSAPALVASLGPNNGYDELAQIEIERGKIEADASWTAQAAPFVVRGDLFVDAGATLTVAPGSRLAFLPGVILGVGYYDRASLVMRGSAEAPITLGPAGPDASAQRWGVILGSEAAKVRFEHVALRETGGGAGIELRAGADATLVNVDCASCAGATVKWACDSTVGNIKVSASEGTPVALLAPTGC